MKKFKFGLLLFISLFLILLFDFNAFAQTPPDLPSDGSGEYLDQVPINGGLIFVLVALGIGGIILIKKQKIAEQKEKI